MKHALILIALSLPLGLSAQVVLQEGFWTGTYIEKDGEKLSPNETVKLFGDNPQALAQYQSGLKDGRASTWWSLAASGLTLAGALTIGGDTTPAIPLICFTGGITSYIVSMSKYNSRRKKWNRAVALYNQ